MSNQEAIQIVQENIAAFNAGDAQKLAATLAENSVYQEFATQRTAQGRQSVVQTTMQWRQAFPDARGTIQNIVASGNVVTAEIIWEGTHRGTLQGPAGSIPATGKKVQMRASQIVTIEGGKLKQTNHYFDMMGLLQQIGAWQQGQQSQQQIQQQTQQSGQTRRQQQSSIAQQRQQTAARQQAQQQTQTQQPWQTRQQTQQRSSTPQQTQTPGQQTQQQQQQSQMQQEPRSWLSENMQ